TTFSASMSNGSGPLGFLVSSPLVVATTVYVVVPLLVLLGLFSLLVVTATPVRAIPKRLTELYWRLTGGARPETAAEAEEDQREDRKSTRLNSSHVSSSYAVLCF